MFSERDRGGYAGKKMLLEGATVREKVGGKREDRYKGKN